MAELPGGTVTFLFTDVEGSTELLRRVGKDAYAGLLAEHARLVEVDVAAGDGRVVDTQGDAFFAAFPSATAAVACAAQLLTELTSTPLRVRIGIHTGQPALTSTGHAARGEIEAAARLLGATATLEEFIGEAVQDYSKEAFEKAAASVLDPLAEPEIAAAFGAGKAMTNEEAAAHALAAVAERAPL